MLRAAAAALLLTSLLAPAAEAAWPSFHNDERNTGFQSGSAYQVYEDLWWSFKLKNTQIDSSPVVKDGVVLIGAWDKQVRAFDAESGKVLWNATTLGGAVYSTPAIVAGRVFIVDSTGKLEARDLQKGTVLATASVGATHGSITTHEGKLFIGNDAGEMQAFETENLLNLWKFSTSSLAPGTTTTGSGMSSSTSCQPFFTAQQIHGAPVVYDGRVIFGSVNHWVYAVNEQGKQDKTTDPLWIFETGDSIFGTPAVDTSNGNILIGSYDEKVYAIPLAPGGEGPVMVGTSKCSALKNSAAWTFEVPSTSAEGSKVRSSPAVDGNNAYFGANNGRVYAVDLDNGAKVWEYTTGGAVVSSPAVSNNIVVVGSDDAKIYWFNAGNGSKLKEFVADAPIKSSPALDADRTFIASFDGSVYMFGKKIPTRPDLQVTGITYAGGLITVTVNNAGDGKAAASKLRLTVDGALAADLDVAAIEPGQSASVNHAMTLADGVHTLVADADQSALVTESTETNNSQTTTVTAGGTSGGDGESGGKDKKGIPAPAPALAMLALAALALVRRRKA